MGITGGTWRHNWQTQCFDALFNAGELKGVGPAIILDLIPALTVIPTLIVIPAQAGI